MVACCRCNRTGSYKGCACVKAGKSCTNCLPKKLGSCVNAPTRTPVAASSCEVVRSQGSKLQCMQ